MICPLRSTCNEEPKGWWAPGEETRRTERLWNLHDRQSPWVTRERSEWGVIDGAHLRFTTYIILWIFFSGLTELKWLQGQEADGHDREVNRAQGLSLILSFPSVTEVRAGSGRSLNGGSLGRQSLGGGRWPRDPGRYHQPEALRSPWKQLLRDVTTPFQGSYSRSQWSV